MNPKEYLEKSIKHEISISDQDFAYVQNLIKEKAGIHIDEHKKIMIQSRLSRRIRELGLSDYASYITYLKSKNSELNLFINVLTTNKTELFREKNHFDHLHTKVLPHLIKSNPTGKMIYVWSAACSTGDEVHTLAMTLENFCEAHPSFDYRVLGTDINTEILSRAEKRHYTKEDIEAVPPNYRNKYLQYKNGSYYLKDELLDKIKFRRHNLIDPNDRVPITFDVIFLRNVMIYFTKETIEKVIAKINTQLHSGGYLYIGHSETLGGIKHGLKQDGTAIYKK